MAVGVLVNICSFVAFVYVLSIAFKKLFAQGPHENLAMKIGLVCIYINFPCWCTTLLSGLCSCQRRLVLLSVRIHT